MPLIIFLVVGTGGALWLAEKAIKKLTIYFVIFAIVYYFVFINKRFF